jgi:hypothetical protein
VKKRKETHDDQELRELQEYIRRFPQIDSQQWPRFRYEVKDDYIRIIRPDGSTWQPIPPGSSRTYEVYKIARQCLDENLRGQLVTPREYERLFKALNLEELRLELYCIHYRDRPAGGETRSIICVVCLNELTGKQKRYCSDRCKDTLKKRVRIARGQKSDRGSSRAKHLRRCTSCNHLMALHKPGHCIAANCDCKA